MIFWDFPSLKGKYIYLRRWRAKVTYSVILILIKLFGVRHIKNDENSIIHSQPHPYDCKIPRSVAHVAISPRWSRK